MISVLFIPSVLFLPRCNFAYFSQDSHLYYPESFPEFYFVKGAFNATLSASDPQYAHVGYREVSKRDTAHGIVRSDYSRGVGLHFVDSDEADGSLGLDEGMYMTNDSCVVAEFNRPWRGHRVMSPCPKALGICKAPIGAT